MVKRENSEHEDQDEIVAFAVQWAPFGGGSSDEIFVTFGISELTYFERLRHILATYDSFAGIDEDTWRRLCQVCVHRLSTGSA
ncbi:hypothetical protein QNM97_01475 [Gordonia sp. L191]|uniref:hypothetical protein n=1 Tax=Gordonia sp. L191 TaxID=2982699 RepID=UPI0024C092AD|nr:hypothetical protein [Gordonia sp. L191]WHU47717.1 hypothetical protein QNM97_01475 [Gordonia sp. L191]